MHRAHVVYPPVSSSLGWRLWLAVYESGVHATIAGVVMGLLTPARPFQTELEADEIVDVLEGRADLHADDVRATATAISGSVSACDRLIEALHPWTSYVIVPIFALANAGIVLSADAFSPPSAVLSGVAVGLVVGKLLGVAGFSWLAVRIGLGRLPDGARWGHIIGVAAVAGIGFTVSLFITGLAFDSGHPARRRQDRHAHRFHHRRSQRHRHLHARRTIHVPHPRQRQQHGRVEEAPLLADSWAPTRCPIRGPGNAPIRAVVGATEAPFPPPPGSEPRCPNPSRPRTRSGWPRGASSKCRSPRPSHSWGSGGARAEGPRATRPSSGAAPCGCRRVSWRDRSCPIQAARR